MEFLHNLLFETSSVAHSVFVLAVVITIGVLCGRIKIAGVSLGITWILFAGIAMGHFNMGLDPGLNHFVKEFGLILFVYSIGLQVGPGFFAAFRKGGLKLNMIAVISVLLSATTAVCLHFITQVDIGTMVGVLSGAVTNTPGLGAAQQAWAEVNAGSSHPAIGMGYAVAYPLGVVGTILSFIAMRYIFGVNKNPKEEEKRAQLASGQSNTDAVQALSVKIANEALANLSVVEVMNQAQQKFVISRIMDAQTQQVHLVTGDTTLHLNDSLLIIASQDDAQQIAEFFGDTTTVDWAKHESNLISRRILITKPELNGKPLASLKLRNEFNINITRINRAGVDLMPTPNLQLQMGDRVTVVGSELAISQTEKVLGNSLKRLNHPNLIPIFLGIALGCFLGTIPIYFPGMPQAVKLGLAGGPLIVAILIGRFGPQYKMVTYTTVSANLMLREIGISLFLACVGLEAGKDFVHTLVNEGGVAWIGYGAIITVIPLFIAGCIARFFFKINYYTLTGVLSGGNTNPPALAFSNAQTPNDAPSVGYATVYPLAMFLRILTAQLIVLILA